MAFIYLCTSYYHAICSLDIIQCPNARIPVALTVFARDHLIPAMCIIAAVNLATHHRLLITKTALLYVRRRGINFDA